VLIAGDKPNLDSAASGITAIGAKTIHFAIDLRLPQSAETIITGTLERFGRIDAMLNIAGPVPKIDLFQMTDPRWDDGMALKFHDARRLTMRAWDAPKVSKGSVVFMSGNAALAPKPGNAAVAAINAAINALAKSFAEQRMQDGVRVNSISPGAVMTGRRQAFFGKWAPAHNFTVEDAIKKFPEQADITRFGKPEEIADLMSNLVSPAAQWMTGASVRMDGGEIKGI
jgi:3-oxoacyl-[acyl-carrier protein] reductase